MPVSDYTSVFTVTPAGKNKTSVTWSGRFKRKNLGEHPAENENDKTAVDTIGAVYTAGLDNLEEARRSAVSGGGAPESNSDVVELALLRGLGGAGGRAGG